MDRYSENRRVLHEAEASRILAKKATSNLVLASNALTDSCGFCSGITREP